MRVHLYKQSTSSVNSLLSITPAASLETKNLRNLISALQRRWQYKALNLNNQSIFKLIAQGSFIHWAQHSESRKGCSNIWFLLKVFLFPLYYTPLSGIQWTRSYARSYKPNSRAKRALHPWNRHNFLHTRQTKCALHPWNSK